MPKTTYRPSGALRDAWDPTPSQRILERSWRRQARDSRRVLAKALVKRRNPKGPDYAEWRKSYLKSVKPGRALSRMATQMGVNPPARGRNTGSFEGRKGQWRKGKGGKFVGSV